MVIKLISEESNITQELLRAYHQSWGCWEFSYADSSQSDSLNISNVLELFFLCYPLATSLANYGTSPVFIFLSFGACKCY